MKNAPKGSIRARLFALLLPAGLAAAGLGLNFGPTLSTGLQRVQTDPGDSRLVNYDLEHAFLWLVRDPLHLSYWDPPIYHPVKNVQGLLDSEIGALPAYAPWRWLGAEPDTAFQLWMMTVAVFNFAAFMALLRVAMRIRPAAAAVGAFLFAFALSRGNYLQHQQLCPAFYIALSLFCLVKLFSADTPDRRRGRWLIGFFAATAAQFYCGFYMFWFFCFTLALAALCAMFGRRQRGALLACLRAQWPAAIAGLALFALMVAPLAIHYLRAARDQEAALEQMSFAMLPRLQSWFNFGPESWTWGWLGRQRVFAGLPGEGESRMGLGLVTLALAVTGLYRRRKEPMAWVLAITTVALMAATTNFPVDITLWSVVRAAVPGAKAVRAVARVGLLLLIPAAIGLAWFWEDAFREGRRRWLAVVLLLAVLAEQGLTTFSYNKFLIRDDVARVAAAVTPDCESFLLTASNPEQLDVSWKYHMDAIWAGALVGKPTLNGQAARVPAGLGNFGSVLVTNDEKKLVIRRSIYEYSVHFGQDPTRVCWVHAELPVNWIHD